MRLDFAGTHRIAAPRPLVWSLLLDPEAVRRSAHGVERIEILEPTRWIVHLAIGLGPLAIRMRLETRMQDLREPEAAEMWLDGAGAGTEMRLRTAIRLEAPDPGLTILRWDATAEVAGTAAGLGRRLVEATAQGFTTDFWRRFAEDAARRAARETAERPVTSPASRPVPRRVAFDRRPAALVADVYGDAGGVPLVLLHGMWCDRTLFRAVAGELARGRTVVVPDLRAHGEAAGAPAGWGVRDLGADLAALLDALGMPRADLLGFSLGGMVILPFVLGAPGRARALALVSTTAEAEGAVRHAEMRLLAGILRRVGASPALLEPAAGYMFSAAFRRQQPGAIREWLTRVEAMTGEDLAQATEAVAGRPDLSDRLAEVRHPALVVAGSADTTLPPAQSERLAAALPRGRYVSLEDAGHGLPLERPHELAALVGDFLHGVAEGEE